MEAGEETLDALFDDLAERRIDRRQFFQRAAALGLSLSAAGALLEQKAHAATHAATTLKLRFDFDIANVDPAFYPAHVDEAVMESVNEGLVSFRPGTWELVNTLAESFERSKDGLRYQFKLKRGIPFHKGYGEVTAEDVKYSYERIAGLTKPNLHAVYQGDWNALARVKVTGRYSGVIILKEPFSAMLRSTLPVTSGKVLSEKAVLKLGKKYATNPIGTGPYEFAEWVPKQRVVLKRFSDYGGAASGYSRRPQWEDIVILPIKDDSAAETALEAGDIDFSKIPTNAVDRIAKNSKFNLVRRTTLDYNWVGMSVKNIPNKDLRLAVRYGIDVPGILQAAYDGKWERARAIIPEGMQIGYWPNAPTYNRDVDKAKFFLKRSGETNPQLTLHTTNAEADTTAAQAVQQNLKDVGIDVKVIPVDPGTFNDIPGAGGGGKGRQLTYVGYVTEPDPSWSTVWFTHKQLGLWNWLDWDDKRFNDLHFKGLRVQDPARRTPIYIELQRVWDQAANIVWVAYPTLYFAGKKAIRPSIRPDGRMLPWNFRSA